MREGRQEHGERLRQARKTTRKEREVEYRRAMRYKELGRQMDLEDFEHYAEEHARLERRRPAPARKARARRSPTPPRRSPTPPSPRGDRRPTVPQPGTSSARAEALPPAAPSSTPRGRGRERTAGSSIRRQRTLSPLLPYSPPTPLPGLGGPGTARDRSVPRQRSRSPPRRAEPRGRPQRERRPPLRFEDYELNNDTPQPSELDEYVAEQDGDEKMEPAAAPDLSFSEAGSEAFHGYRDISDDSSL